ncbi:DedA family protein [Corynebacterium sp. 320]|uniref:DedA family protein n=1 Tax=Corynebacterium zhongnanshanii TaxID=2768834 RepID=A0ABQ6VFL6_9CORY|nr:MULTISPECIES: VTT domain-containing protein [Corynebacterium]KAB1503946.1 DedA family protein [Corynebacterium sp. 320]KAB1552955.1 DedA family protein [Corynebacterium sp. 321]KAB1553825.1 DedA family protein [Corynebacterium sp. 319]KAB3523204.1 DedA family protein [Corynebacterium zhongnanshanii]KAB3528082.1 DedA family protein [Corynebacterium sp. 250]
MSETVMALGPEWADPMVLLSGSGPFGDAILAAMALIVFIESGLLFPFLPGDSLLFTAGLLARQPDPFAPLWLIMVVAPIAAFLGDQVGYMIGHKLNPYLEQRPDGKIFKREYVTQTEDFFDKHGPITVILCRFVPIVRTYAPLVAGMAGMHYRTFVAYNAIGAVLWGAGVVGLGALLGEIDFVKNNIEAIFLVIVLASVVPALYGVILKWFKKEKKA